MARQPGAARCGLPSWTPALLKAARRRIIISQGIYFAAMLVSVFGVVDGLALMRAVQLNHAIASRHGRWMG